MTAAIREATAADVPALVALAAVTFPLACPPAAGADDIAEFIRVNLGPDSFATYIGDPQRIVLLAHAGDQLLGYSMLVALAPSDPQVAAALTIMPSVELSKCYVHPDEHGAGLARRLMEASVSRAAVDGAAGVWLGVNNENARALRFYEKSGFRRVGTKSFRLGSRLELDFVLERAVTFFDPSA
ncbi:MAG: GNAT family N-acetyltransferase [Actinomycetota bacterium]|nr:GNAT family N-acetyltransferase [Actinomycetota bacterium]